MNTLSFRTLLVILSVRRPVGSFSDLSTCHDDFGLKPADGILKKNTFGWLGFVQYLHVTTGIPHQTKAPRVMLIQKQFVIGTAVDMLQLPKNYKLGNIIFGEYEREEVDCGMTQSLLKLGGRCGNAYLEMPLLDIIPHPEYTRFGVGNSLALIKLLHPLKSRYMVPICMPSTLERKKIKKKKFVFFVDYMSRVPQNFDNERMGKKTLKLFTHKECRTRRTKARLNSEGLSHMLCSTGCGIRSGAPIVSQSSEGLFELIGLAAGGALCGHRAHRRRFVNEPPIYIDVYPYTSWIVNFITAQELPLPYPISFRRVDGGSSMGIYKEFMRTKKPQRWGWRGRTFLSGNLCFKSRRKQQKAAFFYSEVFEVNTLEPTRLIVQMQISAGIECTIVCARLVLPNRMVIPQITGVGGFNISIEFTTEFFPKNFNYKLSLMGKNTTQKNLEEWMLGRDKAYW